MIGQRAIEITQLKMARKNGEPFDRKTLFMIRNEATKAQQANERRRQSMNTTTYKWKKPA